MSQQAEIDRLRTSTIKQAIGPTILLGSGTYFDYVDPDSSQITLEDVAYGLGYEGRFAGQCFSKVLKRRMIYVSGQHSVLTSYVVDPGLELEGLWHEAGEAVCGDMTGPLKSLCPEYKVVEKRCEKSILSKFSIRMDHPLEIKVADVRMLMTERRDLLNWQGETWSSDGVDGLKPFDFQIVPWTPDESAEAFIERHLELTVPGYKSRLLQRLLPEGLAA